MAHFLSSAFYESIAEGQGVGIALDEGLASESDVYDVFYGERLPWWVEVTASGSTGHGSRFIEPTAMSQIIKFSQKALRYREEQKEMLHGCGRPGGCGHAVAAKKKKVLGDVTTLNITAIKAGVGEKKLGCAGLFVCVCVRVRPRRAGHVVTYQHHLCLAISLILTLTKKILLRAPFASEPKTQATAPPPTMSSPPPPPPPVTFASPRTSNLPPYRPSSTRGARSALSQAAASRGHTSRPTAGRRTTPPAPTHPSTLTTPCSSPGCPSPVCRALPLSSPLPLTAVSSAPSGSERLASRR